MKSQPAASYRKWIAELRIPAVKGIPDDIYHMLHHNFVGIAKMRRSIEAVVDRSMEAIHELQEILDRLGREFSELRSGDCNWR